MDDYYSPHPRVLLPEPLLLVGQVGSGVASTARAISARTGLPFAEIDRSVENAAGHSLPHIVANEGLAALASHTDAAIRRALLRRPCPVIAFGSAAATSEQLREIQGQARIVYLRRPPDVLLRRIQAQLTAQPGSLYQFSLATPQSSKELQPLLDAQEPALRAAHVIVEAGSRAPQTVAAELIEALDRIAGAESL